MRPGLLFVLSQPGAVSLADFHAWYDEEHAPARMAFPEIEHGTRWSAADGQVPGWLATYDVDLAVLDRPDYTILRERRSNREQAVIAGLTTFARRTYELVASAVAPSDVDSSLGPRPGPLVVAVSLDVPETRERELNAWYDEEHVPLLHAIPGWRRTRRFRLLDGDAPRWLALHDLDGPEPFDTPAYTEATSTPRRHRVMAAVTRRERRVFAAHRRFD